MNEETELTSEERQTRALEAIAAALWALVEMQEPAEERETGVKTLD